MNETVNKIVNMVNDIEDKCKDAPIKERDKIIDEYIEEHHVFDGISEEDRMFAIMLAALELFEVGK